MSQALSGTGSLSTILFMHATNIIISASQPFSSLQKLRFVYSTDIKGGNALHICIWKGICEQGISSKILKLSLVFEGSMLVPIDG